MLYAIYNKINIQVERVAIFKRQSPISNAYTPPLQTVSKAAYDRRLKPPRGGRNATRIKA